MEAHGLTHTYIQIHKQKTIFTIETESETKNFNFRFAVRIDLKAKVKKIHRYAFLMGCMLCMY